MASFKELRGAVIGTSELRLAETHKQFRLSKSEWITKDARQMNKHIFDLGTSC